MVGKIDKEGFIGFKSSKGEALKEWLERKSLEEDYDVLENLLAKGVGTKGGMDRTLKER